MTTAAVRFAEAAEAFCAWCETPATDGPSECRAAIRHLSNLYRLALDLRSRDDADPDVESAGVDREQWESVYSRHRELPFTYYWEVFEPVADLPDEPVAGDLADDLADTYGDLMSGLLLFRIGHIEEAEDSWHDHFQFHWGCHATSAIRAIHRWFAQDRSRWTA